MIVPRGLGGSKDGSGGAGRFDHQGEAAGGDLGWASRAFAHDFLDGRVAATATGPSAGAITDRFDRAHSFARAGANRSVGHGMTVADDQGALDE
jgi:hypothetical protein